jgi:hypothetical protein
VNRLLIALMFPEAAQNLLGAIARSSVFVKLVRPEFDFAYC